MHRARWEMSSGLTWYVHKCRHSFVDAKYAIFDNCDLAGYWWYSVAELLTMVRKDLTHVVDDYRLWFHSSRSRLTLALESLSRLSREHRACEKCDLLDSSNNIRYMQDLPQTSRCRHDIDAGRDFARSQGYFAMFMVLRNWGPYSVQAKLAASVLAGFFAGLPVLPWQPARDKVDKDLILDMLRDEDFRYCTRDLLRVLLQLLEPYGWGSPDKIADDKLRVQEAAASAICAIALAASDINAIVNCPVRLRLHEKSAHFPDNSAMRGYVARLSYAFTTICPVGWHLGTDWPTKFDDAFRGWVADVKERLCDERTVEILLACAQNEASSSIVEDCIRTLSWLWTRRTIYWHRHDKRMKDDFPPPLGKVSEANLPDLRYLLYLYVDRPESLSPLIRLHLAKIFISQRIREVDKEVSELLLQCLRSWKSVPGTRELDWFATETIESLRDLLHDAVEDSKESKQHLKRQIWESAGAISCLRWMLEVQASIVNRIKGCSTNVEGFADHLRRFLGRYGSGFRAMCGEEHIIACWAMSGAEHITGCTAAAAGLLADALEVPESRGIVDTKSDVGEGPGGDSTRQAAAACCRSSEARGEQRQRIAPPLICVLPDDPRQNRMFFMSFFKRLNDILCVRAVESENPDWFLRPGNDAVKAGAAREGGFNLFLLRITTTPFMFFSRILSTVWESLGNPAWIPAYDIFKDDITAGAADLRDTIEVFERALNSLLAARNVVRVIDLVLQTYPDLEARLVTVLIPSMVDLLTKPFAGLPTRLQLQELEESANQFMKERIIKVLTLIVPRIAELAGDSTAQELKDDPALPSMLTLEKAKNELLVWARQNAANDADVQQLLNVIQENPECSPRGPTRLAGE
ncbi:hypothetical protein CBR_g55427 [Chara braunii]|uniref:Uncharacterized protein n=1 Tax=Chara braunii TaxID=69332 RepID=A0A388K7Q4_CHABU|nr:hypothetical protein CBR_g55427 [Chara braunii]|eukprot:GBG66084.1 hypothetical protein CBR_g55427 [Chara braunii]